MDQGEDVKTGSRRGTQDRRWGLLLALTLGVVLLAGQVLAQERSLTEGSPPAGVSEIQTPIQQVFPEEPERFSLFGPRIKDAHPFFADTRFEVRLRSYNWKQNSLIGLVSEDWAGGGSLYYRSGRLWEVVALEVEGFTSQPIWTPENRVPSRLLQPDRSGYSVLGILNADLSYAGMNLKAGRLYHDLPYMNRSDGKMTPNTFESITLEKPAGEFKLTVGYTSKIKGNDSDRFVSMTEFIGLDVDRGLAHGGAVWAPGSDFSLGAIYQSVPDVFHGIYGEALWFRAEPSDNLGIRLDSQGTYEKEVGSNLYDIDDSWNAAIRGSLDYRRFLFRMGFSATGKRPILSPFGSSPSYVDLMSRTFTGADEKAMLLSLTCDFGGIGLKGFKAIVNYAQSYDAVLLDDRIRARETDLTLDYRGQKGWWEGLWVRLRQAWRQESWTDEDLYQLRFQVYYTLNVV